MKSHDVRVTFFETSIRVCMISVKDNLKTAPLALGSSLMATTCIGD